MENFDHNKFITEMMRFASSEETPDDIIKHLMKYICENLRSDRAYIFEDNYDGTYDNTYEYCREGVSPEIDNLKGVPYDGVLEVWFTEYERSQNILIYDIEEYKKVSLPLYEVLKPQGIKTLVTGPIRIQGKCVGLYGVDNPPVEVMDIISNLIGMMEFVMSMMIQIRNYAKEIENSSKTDFLTGCKNRKALDWAYENRFGKATSLSILMCDLNGLKQKNDMEGHKAGDRFLCDTADALTSCFSRENVYRVGGDEFVVVMLSEAKQDMERRIDELKSICEQKNISVSMGFEYRDNFEHDFEYALHLADSKMYSAKKRHYELNGIDRRNRK